MNVQLYTRGTFVGMKHQNIVKTLSCSSIPEIINKFRCSLIRPNVVSHTQNFGIFLHFITRHRDTKQMRLTIHWYYHLYEVFSMIQLLFDKH